MVVVVVLWLLVVSELFVEVLVEAVDNVWTETLGSLVAGFAPDVKGKPTEKTNTSC